MKSQVLNDSKISDFENEEEPYELNDNIRTYHEILNKRPQLRNNNGNLVDFFSRDPILDIGYIVSNPLWVVNSNNYSPYGYININKEHQALINNNKYCGFIYKNNFYLLIYNQNNIGLYSCNYINNSNNNKKNAQNNFIFNFSLNSNNNENIVNAQFLPNDLGKAYFIVVMDNYNAYLLNISIDNNNNINYLFEQCSDKNSQSILAKSFSSLWPFNSFSGNIINNISNCFIISPHRQLKKKNNLYTYYNTLFLLSNNSLILKKISFYINNNSINSQIENSKDLSKEIIDHLKSVSKRNLGEGGSINILSADSYFNENIKTLMLYCYIMYNDAKFILRIIVDNNFYVTFDTFNVNSMITNPQVNTGRIFANNYSDEGILVIPNDIIINFNYENEQNDKNIKGWKSYVHFKKNIIGINKFNQMSVFNLDLFTLDEGIINFNPCLYYSSPNDIKGNYRIEQTDHTTLFLSNFLKGQLLPYATNNNSNNNTQLFKSIYRLNSNSSINSNSKNENLNNSFQSNSQRALKPYEIILNNEKKKEFHVFLDEIIKKYMYKNSYLNEINEKEQYIINKLEGFFNNNQINNNKENTLYDLLGYIDNIINNDTTHIEIIEKSKTKAKLLTVHYLEEKYHKLMILFQLIKECKVEGIKIFYYYPDLLNEFFKIFEKITVGINICKQENIYLEKLDKNADRDEKLITLFLDNFYNKIKGKLENKNKFNHMFLFCNISNINEQLLNTFFECYKYIFNNNYSNDDSNYDEQKDNFLLFIINIILGINEDIQTLIDKINDEKDKNKNNLIKYNNGLWYLSNNNYVCNQFLMKVFKDVYKWKTQLYKDSKIDNDTIFLFGEQLHFLFKKYLLLGNNSLKDKTDYINNQKSINSILCHFNIERTYHLAKKYYDHYTIAKIAFNDKNKYYDDLKQFMNNELSKKRGHIKYILQLILEFEIQYLKNCKNNNNVLFNYFEDFDSFSKEIETIVKNSEKLQNFYNLYLLKKNIEINLDGNCGRNLVQNIIIKMGQKYDLNQKTIDFLTKILCVDKSLNLIQSSHMNNNDNNIIKDAMDEDLNII